MGFPVIMTLDSLGMMLVAEISGNHLGSKSRAKELISAAQESGATHVKIQTYTPDTITINCDSPSFLVSKDHPIWGNRTLYSVYQEAHTPFEWHSELFEFARNLGVKLFSTPFDLSAVELLEKINTPLYKIASLESGDIELIKAVAKTGKPVMASTGATTLHEIDNLVNVFKSQENLQLTLLLCTSAYPTPVSGVNLERLKLLQNRYNLPVGLSDHTLGLEASLGAVALGAKVIERHFTLLRSDGGPDCAFSLEPSEFRSLSASMEKVALALGDPEWNLNPLEDESRRFRRSLYVVRDVRIGEELTNENVRSIRPSGGLDPMHLQSLIGRIFVGNYKTGTPLTLEMLT
jgi:pseudaminic acid synthase